MGLTRVAITRPVFILMVISAMVILVAWSRSRRLNAELYPNISSPVVTIVTTYSGASPEDVERLVTQADRGRRRRHRQHRRAPVVVDRGALADHDHLHRQRQRRRLGHRRRAASRRGPQPATRRRRCPVGPQARPVALPVLYLAIDRRTCRPGAARTSSPNDQVKPRLESQNGVGSVDIAGGLEREIQVQVDPEPLRAYGLTIDQVPQALARENQGVPGGSIEQGPRSRSPCGVYGLFQSVGRAARADSRQHRPGRTSASATSRQVRRHLQAGHQPHLPERPGSGLADDHQAVRRQRDRHGRRRARGDRRG